MNIRGHYDGKVVVLDEPADLKPNQQVTVSPASDQTDPRFGTLDYVLTNLGPPISDEDARQMREAIEDAFEQIEPEPDVQL